MSWIYIHTYTRDKVLKESFKLVGNRNHLNLPSDLITLITNNLLTRE